MITYLQSIGKILLKTGLAALVPFIPALTSDFAGSWDVALFTVALAVVIAAATALVSIPDLAGQGWLVTTLAKALRQFGQVVLAASAGAVLLTDIEWGSVLQIGAVAALTTLVIAAVSSLSDGERDPVPVTVVADDRELTPSL